MIERKCPLVTFGRNNITSAPLIVFSIALAITMFTEKNDVGRGSTKCDASSPRSRLAPREAALAASLEDIRRLITDRNFTSADSLAVQEIIVHGRDTWPVEQLQRQRVDALLA
jgi:hypothetical protein